MIQEDVGVNAVPPHFLEHSHTLAHKVVTNLQDNGLTDLPYFFGK